MRHPLHRRGSRLVMHKSQLLEFTQKARIHAPVYEVLEEGDPSAPRFRCIVTVNGVSYVSDPDFSTVKAAEHAAAKVALDDLTQNTLGKGVSPSPVHHSGLCKNLLQEYAQIHRLPLPVYQSTREGGADHAPIFSSSVEIAGVRYCGGRAKTKKEAEIQAASTALAAIQSALDPTEEAEFPEPQIGISTFNDLQVDSTVRNPEREPQASTSAEFEIEEKIEFNPAVNSNTAREATPVLHVATPAEAAADKSLPVTAAAKKPMEFAQKEGAPAQETPMNIADIVASRLGRKARILGFARN